MAKQKGARPNQPAACNMLADGHHSAPPNGDQSRFTHHSPPPGPQDAYQEPERESEGETQDAYARLDNNLRDFIWGISRGYSVRHSCRMSGEDYEIMLDYLNSKGPLFKPELFKLVEKARAVAYARQVEKLNSATDWHAAAFWLERREKREYGPPRAGIPLEEEERPERRALIRMTPETLDALSQAYDAEHGNPGEERETL